MKIYLFVIHGIWNSWDICTLCVGCIFSLYISSLNGSTLKTAKKTKPWDGFDNTKLMGLLRIFFCNLEIFVGIAVSLKGLEKKTIKHIHPFFKTYVESKENSTTQKNLETRESNSTLNFHLFPVNVLSS